jgi:uncharacterized membrane protein YGL010W
MVALPQRDKALCSSAMKIPAALLPKKSLDEYMIQYAQEHTQLGTKLTHMVGIPMIVASIPTAVVSPPAAGALFAGGWALQLAGHYFFEKQKPSFLSDPYYLFVGPVWVAVEWAHLFGMPVPERFAPKAEAKDEAANGVAATTGAKATTETAAAAS